VNVLLLEDLYLLSSIVQLLLRILEHFLTPQVKEVIRIGVELQAILTVLPEIQDNNQGSIIPKLDYSNAIRTQFSANYL
jgi:hypothetical protein